MPMTKKEKEEKERLKKERIKRLMEEKKKKAKKEKEYKSVPTMVKSKNTITSKGQRLSTATYPREKKV